MSSKITVIALAGFVLAVLPHCGSQYADLCEAQRNCSGGNDKDVDACVEAFRAQEKVASAYDCDSQWDTVSNCLDTATCKDRRLDTSACEAQVKALSDCQKAATGRKQATTDGE
ncbi:MAG TPA: hypothetical protein VM925_21565 [Labilithrix sp.]|jgi:hypothetical protein|nr:hypothetical protein [Labilithrix sp.]